MWTPAVVRRAGPAGWRRTWIGPQVLRSFSTSNRSLQQAAPSAPTTQQTRVYELRTYNLYPNKAGEYLRLTEALFHLRTAHSKLLGYWTAEIGGLNQVVHMWEYDSLSHRAGVRTRLAGDPEWTGQYVSKVVNTWQSQDNALLTLLPNTQLTFPSAKGVYELQTLQLQGAPGVWSRPLVEYVKACGAACGGTSLAVGAWCSVLGPRQMAALLWQHQDQDGCLTLNAAANTLPEGTALAPYLTSGHSKLLLPHPVSNLQ